MVAATLANLPSAVLPPTVAGPIFDKTNEVSAVQQLARKVPLSLTANTVVPVSMDIPVAGWVSEGGSKPVGSSAFGIKQMSGKKLALLVPFSEEIVRTNAAGVYDQLQQDLPTALARAFDYAAIRGLDLRTGGAGPFADYLTKGANTVELGTTSQANGGMYADLVKGEQLVAQAGFDFSGFAGDPLLKPTLKLQTDTTGKPLWVSDPTLGLGNGNLIGYPAYYNRGVSGAYRRSGDRVQVVTITGTPTGGTFSLKIGGLTAPGIAYNAATSAVQTAIRALSPLWSAATVTGSAGGPYTITLSPVGGPAAPIYADGSALTGGTAPAAVVAQSPAIDTKLRAIGGDWSQAAWGQGMDITVKVSTEASYVDEAGTTHSAFQENLVLLLVEAYFGFVKSDSVGAFTAYTDAV
ncbi:phage major capsid protein [Leifsonia sp. NPDC058194]|uniref:phage major capsid protein n=1 Tax=Leifsonia sp. NPDC058194 TaxID=3346374 RepID=UPI0036DA5D92